MRSIHRKLISWLVMVSILSMLLMGVTVSQAAKKVSLSFWSGYPEMEPVFNKIVEDYRKLHPNVDIDVSTYKLREVERKLAVSIPTRTGPDIFQRMPYIGHRFVEGGYIEPLPPELDTLLKSKVFTPYHVEFASHKGKTYALPMFQGVEVMFWNRDMFYDAGLVHAPTTWEELIDYAKKLVKSDAAGNMVRSGISLRLSGAGSGVTEKWWFWVWPAGGTIVEKTPTGKYHNGYNNQAGREALKLYIDLLYKYNVDGYEVKHDAEAFALGATAMFTRESWVVGYINEHAPNLNYDAAILPEYRRWGTNINPENTYVTKKCKNLDVAFDFVKFMLKPEYGKLTLETSGWFPARRDIDYTSIFKETPQFRAFVEFPEGYGAYGYPKIGAIDEVMTKFAERLVAAYTRKDLLDNPEGIAKVIAEAAEETDNILKEAGLYGEK